MKAAEFKQACLALMDEVATRRETILVTKRGKVVAKLAPVTDERPQALGCLKSAKEIIDADFSLPDWPVSARKGRA